ncbi:MAG: hypothetical protein ACT4RN_08345 [Pseudonocardia sp.]
MARTRARWAITAATVVTLLAGCSAGQQAQTAQQAGSSGGAAGAVGTMLLRDAVITYDGPIPAGEVYRVGQDAPLQVTIVNDTTGRVAEAPVDRLVAVRSPIATSGRITGDAVIPDGQVLTAGYDEPLSSVTPPGTTAVEIVLVGLTEPVRAGLSYPVEFTFERAGTVRLDLPVEYVDVLPPRAFEDELPEGDRTLETGPEVGPREAFGEN